MCRRKGDGVQEAEEASCVSFVVPDSIEPVLGWRCFDIHDGVLYSPQQRMPWPPAAKATAGCTRDQWYYEWVQRTPRQRERMERKALDEGFTPAEGHYIRFQMASGDIEEVPVYMPWGMSGSVPPIRFYPAEGKEWVLSVKVVGHPAPDKGCHCGIHIARDFGHALEYRGQARNAAIGLVKGWGEVIPGSRAFRVQYAYPTKLYLFKRPEGDLDLSAYQIELAPIIECEEYLDAIGVTWR